MSTYIRVYLTLCTLLFLSILASTKSFAQENQGYVILTNGDTLHGYILVKNWDVNPLSFNIVRSNDGNEITYTPLDVLEFKVEDEIYKGAIVNAEISPTEAKDLDYDPTLKIRVDTVFLQTLYQGPKSLYYYKNKDGRENFYVAEEENYTLLEYKQFLRKSDGKDVLGKIKKYQVQLNAYLGNCPGIYSEIEDAEYSSRDLKKLFDFYYECTGDEFNLLGKSRKAKVDYGPIAGISITSLSFESPEFRYLTRADFSSSTDFTGGFYINVTFAGLKRRLSFYNDLVYTGYKTNGTFVLEDLPGYYNAFETRFEYSYLKLNTMMRYRIPLNSMHIFINVGMSNAFALSETNETTETLITASSGETVTTEPALEDTKSYEQGYILGAGIGFQRYGLEFRYEGSTGMSNYSSLDSPVQRIYILVYYRI